jgi:DnaJ-class molecular chaperone
MGDAVEYIRVQRAREALVDPVKRFAYDRFGPDILQWKHCLTARDYVVYGLQQMIPGYIGSIIGMVIAQFLGKFPQGTYVRSSRRMLCVVDTNNVYSGTI